MNSTSTNLPCHLLMVTNTLARGGGEGMLTRLALTLDPQVVRPVVVCLKEPGVLADSLTERGIPVYSWQLRHKFDAFALLRLSRLVKQYPPACVMAVGSGGDRMFWGTLAAHLTHRPMIVWSHQFPTEDHLAFEWVNRRLYWLVEAFVSLGKRHHDALISLEGVPADKLSVIRNGINFEQFDKPGSREEARRLLKAGSDETVVIGIIANLRADKRHDIFIEAAKKMRSSRYDCRFVIIGDGPERASVQRMVMQVDPDGAFISMLGEREDVATVLQGLDIVCLTSEWQECLSIAMLEAMAGGKVFVAPRIGSLDEALIDGETGRFFDPLTPDALAEVLTELVDQPDLRKILGEQARAKVRAEFAEDRMAREFESLVTNLHQHCDG